MRSGMKTEIATYRPDVGQAIFDNLIVLNNELASLSHSNLVPVLGYEQEIGRERAIAAVGAVLGFLRTVGIPGECREPILALYMALGDAKAGRSNPILKPSPMIAGTLDKLLLATLDDGMAAAAAEILIIGGMKAAAAIREVAAAFGYKPAKLTQLRKDLRSSRRSSRASAPAVEAFEYWKGEFRRKGEPARDFVTKLIATRGFRSGKA